METKDLRDQLMAAAEGFFDAEELAVTLVPGESAGYYEGETMFEVRVGNRVFTVSAKLKSVSA